MNLNTWKQIVPALETELEAVFKKYGLNLVSRQATVYDERGTINMKIVLADANMKDNTGAATNPDAENYKKYAAAFLLPPDGVGKIITLQGRKFEIKGMRTGRSRKNIILARVGDDKTFVTTPDSIRHLLVNK